MPKGKKEKNIFLKKDGELVVRNFPGYFLIACIVVSSIFLLRVFQPFITVIILAAILSTAFYPLYRRVLKLFRNHEKGASLFTCLLVLFFIVVPVVIFIFLLSRQAYDIYKYIEESLRNGTLDLYLKWETGGVIYDLVGSLRELLNGFVDLSTIDLKDSIIETAKSVAQFLAAQSANIVKGFVWLFISFFILLFAMYYFFKDAKHIIKKLMVLSPLPDKHEHELFRKFKEISLATLNGIFLTSVVQGIIGGIGIAIAGIPNALFWGTAIAIFSLVPVIGTSIIWLPASIILFLTGHVVSGAFLFFWGLLIVSTIDNFLRAYLIGERTKMNQLLMFLAVFGGILAFELPGVIFGPLILTLFFAFLHIYESEYDKVLHKR